MLLIGLICLATGCGAGGYQPQNGDVVFHESRSSQSEAIQQATDSRYSHMGIVYLQEGEPFVYEAVQPVKLTPLDQWIARGKDGHFVAKRLRDVAALTDPVLARMRAVGEEMAGLDYDLTFEWSDERIYCSELVWKVYKRGAGIEIGELATFADFDVSHPAVAAKVRERFGDALPLEEPVISPAAMFDAPQLETVFRN
ncbi:hypothetical protein ABI59_13150 [Acidobacteria bacterium Mor1]|nr:hypothetical protein ABI59_13150 [Acidobacteria bacterium Mor1]